MTVVGQKARLRAQDQVRTVRHRHKRCDQGAHAVLSIDLTLWHLGSAHSGSGAQGNVSPLYQRQELC